MMIQKIRNRLLGSQDREYLDFTTTDTQNKKIFNLVGLEIISRPYHRWALVVAGSMALFSLILPFDMGLGIFGGIKFLGRYG